MHFKRDRARDLPFRTTVPVSSNDQTLMIREHPKEQEGTAKPIDRF